MTSPEFHLYLPQMRMTFDDIVERARIAENSGFDGIALMDHLAPPQAEDQPMFEAMVTATWLAARTERLKIGHLVLCDAVRHPAVLARQAVSLDHASGGRFELGIGWGSVPAELEAYGVMTADATARLRRLSETLAVLRALWSGDVVSFEGEFHRIESSQQRPTPLTTIPIVIGGVGRGTLGLVATYADWWNVPIYATDRMADLKPLTGKARTSIQQLVAFVPSEADRAIVTEAARRRYGSWNSNLVTGTTSELVDHFSGLCQLGVERFYVWFTDFAAYPTLEKFGEVITELVGDGADRQDG
jgi:alkanesulfonate monooxygenase SsuD/methylene tetrahydromethanopterin reductase-like flavin-dependent oxidoreductase (luciferase family)